MALAGVWRIAFSAHQLLFFSALKATVVTDVVLMNTLAPIVTAVIVIYGFGERPGLIFRLWTLVAVIGAAIVAIAGAVGPAGNPIGMTMAAGNVVFFAVHLMLAKNARAHITVLPFLLGIMVVAGIAVGVFRRGDRSGLRR